ncbi:hypothetical protein AA313_de0200618 [Arthrobotrys entomopaga]|nr:hypothetical protein AA313_de0200618 [Arthrobotrys entomopaga]
MTSKTIIVITGANTGIGYEAVKALLGSEKPYQIYMGARSPDKLEAAIKSLGDTGKHTLAPFEIDLLSDESIKAAYTKISSEVDHIDVLINNAGGTYVVTDVFLPLLIKSAEPRLLFLTSGLSSLEEATQTTSPRYVTPPPGWPKPAGVSFIGYRASKVALNMVMIDFARLLAKDNVKVWCISPGMLATNLGGDPEFLKKLGAGDPALGGIFIKDVVEGARDQDVGKVIRRDGVQIW